jgi:hypothetical protein
MRSAVAGCVAKNPPLLAPSVFVSQVSVFTMIVVPWYPARRRISTPGLSAADCQSALKVDPGSASNVGPLVW